MKDVLLYIVKSIVDNPDTVAVDESTREDGTIVLTLNVHQSDIGKVIGREGKVIKAIRTLVRVVAIRENKRVLIELADDREADSVTESDEDAV